MMDSRNSPSAMELFRLVLWFALLSAIVGYFFVLQISGNPSGEADENLKKILLVVGVVLMVISLGIKHFVRHRVKPAGEVSLPSWTLSVYIVALALGETPAIFGLILGLKGGSMREYFPLFVMALVTYILIAPPLFFSKSKR